MLDIIRQHSQSWGVKLLFGLIVLVFVFWGVGSFNNNSANILAKVNDRTISIQDFLQEYEKRLENLRQQRPNLTSEDIQAMHFKQQVFDSMINQELLGQLAEQEGISAYLLDGPEQIDPAWLEGKHRIGVTAGASAPEVLVQQVIDHLREFGAAGMNELAGREETITFALPKELRVTSSPEG